MEVQRWGRLGTSWASSTIRWMAGEWDAREGRKSRSGKTLGPGCGGLHTMLGRGLYLLGPGEPDRLFI